MCAHFQSMRWQMDKAGLLDVLCLQLPVELGNPATLSYEPGIQTKVTGLSLFKNAFKWILNIDLV